MTKVFKKLRKLINNSNSFIILYILFITYIRLLRNVECKKNNNPGKVWDITTQELKLK